MARLSKLARELLKRLAESEDPWVPVRADHPSRQWASHIRVDGLPVTRTRDLVKRGLVEMQTQKRIYSHKREAHITFARLTTRGREAHDVAEWSTSMAQQTLI